DESGDPQSSATICQLQTLSDTRKLVPALRSKRSRMTAEKSERNASSPTFAVLNQRNDLSGMSIIDIPLVRMSSVVVIKFSALINAPMQNSAMLMIHKSAPAPSPGPADCTALNGGYPVHPW